MKERNASSSLDASSSSSSSFTALLELAPTQVVKLLHQDDDNNTTTLDSSLLIVHPPPPASNPDTTVIPHPPLQEETDVRKKKRKIKEEEEEVVRVSDCKKRSKIEEISPSQLPYVHVRARRGQATDSHSLAERARREKINARMKLLQELVPGCSKISGIALVLDEIINHVQTLQRRVEFLSMQLAAVNPRIELNLDHIMDVENAFVEGSFLSMHPPLEWSDQQLDGLMGLKQSFVQQWQCDAYHQQSQWLKEDNHLESAMIPDSSHLMNEQRLMQLKQLKVEQA